jgi:isoleucyl-tRNA synthetase
VHLPAATKALFDGLPAADIFITSDVTLTTKAAPQNAFRLTDVADVAVVNQLAEGDKCGRCWKVLPEVTASETGICGRCETAVSAQPTPVTS